MEPFHHQNLEKVYTFVQQVNGDMTCGKRLQITTKQLRLETGFPGPFTDVPYQQMSLCATKSWIKSLWAICAEYQISIHDSFGTIPLSREQDLFLMPLFAKFIRDPATLEILNECRMFLKAVTLADICSMDGRHISVLAFTGLRQSQALHRFNWPHQPPALPQTHWNLWQEKLLELFIQVGSKDYLLNKPLGQWLIDPTKHWTWFLEPTEGHIYELTQNSEYEVYIPSVPHRSGARGTIYHHHHTNAERPTSAMTCTVMPRANTDQGNLREVTSQPSPQMVEPEAMPPTSLKQAHAQLNARDQWAATNVTCEDNGLSLAKLIKNGNAIAVSDGSSGSGIATSSFVLTSCKKKDEAKTKTTKGSNTAPGSPDDQDSYRGEVVGMAGAVRTAKMICEVHNITEGSLEIGLDGDSAMKAVFAEGDPKPKDPCYDMILDV